MGTLPRFSLFASTLTSCETETHRQLESRWDRCTGRNFCSISVLALKGVREDVRVYSLFARCADTSVAVYDRASNRNMVLVQRAAQQTNTSLLSSRASMLDFPQVFIFESVCMCVHLLHSGLQSARASRQLIQGWGDVGCFHCSKRAAQSLDRLNQALHVQLQFGLETGRSRERDIFVDVLYIFFRSVEVQVDLLIMYINAIYITYTPLAPIIQILHYISWFVYCWVPLSCQ